MILAEVGVTKFAFALLAVTLKTRWYISICVELGIDAVRSFDSEPNTKRLRDELNEVSTFCLEYSVFTFCL